MILLRLISWPYARKHLLRSLLTTAGIAAVYTLADLEPDPARCIAEAGPLLRRVGQMIARDRMGEAAWAASAIRP